MTLGGGPAATEFDHGVLVGLLIGEGHFGGDGRQPQITLRMHERHEAMFRWLERTYPGSRLYGPYSHGGRRYYQWMVRGAYLRDTVVPLIATHLSPSLDRYAHARFVSMCTQYARQLAIDDSGIAGDHPDSGDDLPAPDRASTIFSALRAADDADPAREG